MSSRIRSPLSRTAAWRLALGPTLVFAAGTTLAFLAMYSIAARSIREHNDAWLNGEVEVLRQVSLATPPGQLYPRIVGAIAASAAQEVTGASPKSKERAEMIFFLHTDPAGRELIWLGPRSKGPFIASALAAQLPTGVPQSVSVPGQRLPFRVVRDHAANGTDIYLGLSDIHAVRLMDALLWRLGWIWFGVVCAGCGMAFLMARRMLARVDSITRAAAAIRTDDLGSRIPEGAHEDEIAQLARTLNRMLDRVADSVTELRSLTDVVAHELKSPITAIRGRLELSLSSESVEASREAAILSIEDLDRLSAFVTTTLDLAEADGGGLRLRREAVDFTDLVSRIVGLYEPAFSDLGRAIELRRSSPLTVLADTSLMHRALANLLDNELHHTPPGTRVVLTTTVVGNTVRLLVEDDGAGFPPELAGRLFERFGKGTTSRGHGLGLALVRAIAVAHGGDLTAGDRAEGGAFVRLTIPAGNRADA
jgi:signal transduction histidine kinase